MTTPLHDILERRHLTADGLRAKLAALIIVALRIHLTAGHGA